MASTSISSAQKIFKYDVFLSFRGEDTRKTFVDHLYHALHQRGITTYKDDVRIEKGERIKDQLITYIKESRLHIIVFSKNYASSSWCLDELVNIMECHKTMEQTAYPIFFDVEPTEVRHQSGPVGEAFAKHEKGSWISFLIERFTRKRKRTLEDVDLEKEDNVGRWRNALIEAANVAGMELKNSFNGHEAKFIQQIVQDISLKLRFFNLRIDGKLVGMPIRVKNVVSSLETSFDDVSMIGIKGMGGGGKTTLARAVFDHMSSLFEGKSFVDNVREVSKGSSSGLKKLQKQVLKDVSNEESIDVASVSDGKDMMKKMLCSRKVLVVLDDVDDIDQLEALAGEPSWFKPGSRIIITTRDEQVLKAQRVNFIHDISLLSNEEAICLFSRYAFGREIPDQGYEDLSGKVVHYAAGLPLTIKVLGSHLCGRTDQEWVDTIERLKKIPLEKTLKRLELSYNGLEDDEKEIFLDVVCILKGEMKDRAIKILESCGFNAQIGLRVLEQKSLITISDRYGLRFHDHIEEMGWNIVRRMHPDKPSTHSRLWIKEEIVDILVKKSGTKAIRSINLKYTDLCSDIIMEGLRKIQELRFFSVVARHRECKVDEVSQYLPDALRSLYWLNYPFQSLPKTFEANNLVNLEMVGSSLFQLWEGEERKVLDKLKYIDLSRSKLKTFNLGMTPNIVTLCLARCVDIVEVHMLSECPKLKLLDLSDSRVSNLKFGMAPHLEVLNLRGCCDLVELHLPKECPYLKSLDLTHSKVRNLNLGMTPRLERLFLLGCKDFVELHMAVECPNLTYLNLSGSKVSNFNLGMTPKLKELNLKGCYHLQEFHVPMGCLKNLSYLEISYCSRFDDFPISKEFALPSLDPVAMLRLTAKSVDICPLHPNNNLPKFRFEGSFSETISSWSGNLEKFLSFGLCVCTNLGSFSASICGLQHLKELTLNGSILEVPKDLGKLESLQKLTLSMKEIKHLPDSICVLKHLKYLDLKSCRLLEHLPNDLGTLERLEELLITECESLRDIPNSIGNMKCLKRLNVSNCCRVGKLPQELGHLECLEELHIRGCGSLRDIPESICKMKCLKRLDLSYCVRVEKLPEELGRLECLEELRLTDWRSIRDIPNNICNMKSLTRLHLRYCNLVEKLPEELGCLECLKELDLTGCESLRDIPNHLCKMKCLKLLNLSRCILVKKLPEELGHLECLEELNIDGACISDLPQSIYQLKGLRIIGSRRQLESYGFTSLKEDPYRAWVIV